MRFLADENFPGDAVTALRTLGHDVLWIRTDAPGITDEEVLARGLEDGRVLLTFEKDFGAYSTSRGRGDRLRKSADVRLHHATDEDIARDDRRAQSGAYPLCTVIESS